MSLRRSPHRACAGETAPGRPCRLSSWQSASPRDTLGTIFSDARLCRALPPVWATCRRREAVALVTILQFRETLADRQAVFAVRARIDWKYLLGLTLVDPGFHFSALSAFQHRLLAGEAEELLETTRRSGVWHAQSARPAADRCDACVGRHPGAQPPRTPRGNTARDPERPGRSCPTGCAGSPPPPWYERYGKRIEDTRLPQVGSRAPFAQQAERGWLCLARRLRGT